jgi:hypothetical protein
VLLPDLAAEITCMGNALHSSPNVGHVIVPHTPEKASAWMTSPDETGVIGCERFMH